MQGNDSEDGKMFVGGLSWDTTKEGLVDYFSAFGQVIDSVIMKDPKFQKPRGFGFVTFSDPSSVFKVLEKHDHYLDNKRIDPKKATTKPEPPMQMGHDMSSSSSGAEGNKKVFLGGLHQLTTEEDLKTYFSRYGHVAEVDIKFDKTTNRMRGFAFVEFSDEDAVEHVCREHFHIIKEKRVEAKKAEPRFASGGGASNQGGGGGGGGGGGYPSYRAGGGGYDYSQGGGGGYSYGQQQNAQQQYYGGYGGYGGMQYGSGYGQYYGQAAASASSGRYGSQQAPPTATDPSQAGYTAAAGHHQQQQQQHGYPQQDGRAYSYDMYQQHQQQPSTGYGGGGAGGGGGGGAGETGGGLGGGAAGYSYGGNGQVQQQASSAGYYGYQ